MPTNYPALPVLINTTQGDIQTRLPGADAMLPVSALGVLSTVLGGAFKGQYGNLAYRAKQLMPDSAEKQYLGRWASIWGVQRKLANAAQFQVTATGSPPADIPAATVLNRSDGARFSTNADIGIESGATTATVTARPLLPGVQATRRPAASSPSRPAFKVC